MKTISSLNQLKSIVGDKVFYVRYSNGPTIDKKYQFSKDHQSGDTHEGLSANELRFLDDDSAVLRGLVEYIFLRTGTNGFGWICFAERTGTDSDNAATINSDTIKVIGKIDLNWAHKILKWSIARQDYLNKIRRMPLTTPAELKDAYNAVPKPEDFGL